MEWLTFCKELKREKGPSILDLWLQHLELCQGIRQEAIQRSHGILFALLQGRAARRVVDHMHKIQPERWNPSWSANDEEAEANAVAKAEAKAKAKADAAEAEQARLETEEAARSAERARLAREEAEEEARG